MISLRRLRWLLAGLIVAGCRDVAAPLPATHQSAELRLEIDRPDAGPGERVAVTVRLPETGLIDGIEAGIRFDPALLRFVGQLRPAAPAVLVGAGSAARGLVKLVALDVDGLPARLGPFVFEVRASGYARALALEPDRVAGPGGGAVRDWWVGPLVRSDVVAPLDEARRLTLGDWVELFAAGQGADRPQRLPGDGTVFGDVNLNGTVNVFDVLAVQNAAAGNISVMTGLTSDFVDAGNVAPANAPGVGEAADPTPPGLEADGSRNLNVFDALAIANYAAGNGDAVAGQPIPGRVAPGGRALLTGVLGADRTLARDTVYELEGTVIVPGGVTLTIEPGTRIEGQSATRGHLSIRRGAMIQALGTRFEPIVFTCASGSPAPGCWGGVTINGAALLNNPPVLGCPSKVEPTGGTYGGCLVDHSSGGLRFVRIEWAGAPWSSGAESAALALNGVGAGTFLEDIQVHRSGRAGC